MSKDYRQEYSILRQICERIPLNEKRALEDDIVNSRVEYQSDDGRIIRFSIKGYDRPGYSGQTPYSVEMRGKNRNGTEIYVLAYRDQNNRLFELEIIPMDDSRLDNLDLSEVKFYKDSQSSGSVE